ncbi:hypothetical protein [Ohtaekwangia sp.]|uniref:hypothetical protein n=1 Tax=Ohtaekwangia sp. TaxID=2066019 RepID=UPI002F9420DE
MKEYKVAKGWAIFIYIVAPVLIGVFLWVLGIQLTSLTGNNISLAAQGFLILISIAMIALMIIGLIDTIKGKVVIDNDKIYTISVFSSRQLMFDEIKGYRLNDKFILIEPTVQAKKKIKISTYFSKTNEIVDWLATHYSDLDLLDAETEKQEILNNAEFGWTTEQREEKLEQAKKASKILNWAGGIAGAWAWFFASPYEYAIIACLVIPIVAILVFRFFRGLIRIDEKIKGAHPNVLWAIFFPSAALGIRALMDFNIFDYSHVWTPTLVISVICVGLLLIGNKEFNYRQLKDYLGVFSACLFIAFYSFGSVIILNCLYDKSEPEVFQAKILNKRKSSGKSTSYYFELTAWGKREKADEVTVYKELYEQLDVNDEVNIYFQKGEFEIPWFIVTE